jgi:hypothetical protein
MLRLFFEACGLVPVGEGVHPSEWFLHQKGTDNLLPDNVLTEVLQSMQGYLLQALSQLSAGCLKIKL